MRLFVSVKRGRERKGGGRGKEREGEGEGKREREKGGEEKREREGREREILFRYLLGHLFLRPKLISLKDLSRELSNFNSLHAFVITCFCVSPRPVEGYTHVSQSMYHFTFHSNTDLEIKSKK